MTVAHGHPWAVWGRTFALMSITHPFGSDVKSMSEFYNKRFLRAVTLVRDVIYAVCCQVLKLQCGISVANCITKQLFAFIWDVQIVSQIHRFQRAVEPKFKGDDLRIFCT